MIARLKNILTDSCDSCFQYGKAANNKGQCSKCKKKMYKYYLSTKNPNYIMIRDSTVWGQNKNTQATDTNRENYCKPERALE